MTRLSDDAVDAIARRVVDQLQGDAAHGAPELAPAQRESLARGGTLPMGVFRTIDECVAAATRALVEFARLGLEPRKAIIEIGRSTRLKSSHLVISYAVFCLK